VARCARSGCGRWMPSALVKAAGLGFLFDGAWHCSVGCLDAAARERLVKSSRPRRLAAPRQAQLRLGVLLVHQVGLSHEVLDEALREQARTGLRLGAQLVRMGAASEHEVLRALAAQAGVGYLTSPDRTRYVPAPANLSPDAVRALGLVPVGIDSKSEVIRVACIAPVPRMAMTVLRDLTGFRVEPYLVSDRQFEEMLDDWRAAQEPEAAPAAVNDLPSAAARVVAAARENGAVRMTEALCNDHVLVRLDTGGRTEDLWLQTGLR
jgi:hypothetical protein